jgi:hypothetical protein
MRSPALYVATLGVADGPRRSLDHERPAKLLVISRRCDGASLVKQ